MFGPGTSDKIQWCFIKSVEVVGDATRFVTYPVNDPDEGNCAGYHSANRTINSNCYLANVDTSVEQNVTTFKIKYTLDDDSFVESQDIQISIIIPSTCPAYNANITDKGNSTFNITQNSTEPP